jgi:hypothetical protein
METIFAVLSTAKDISAVERTKENVTDRITPFFA